jgi:hypothetical protein
MGLLNLLYPSQPRQTGGSFADSAASIVMPAEQKQAIPQAQFAPAQMMDSSGNFTGSPVVAVVVRQVTTLLHK